MDQQFVQGLIDQFAASALTELELHQEKGSLHLKKAAGVPTSTTPAPKAQTPPAVASVIEAPLVGIVYLSPEPGVAPFKQVGDQVAVGDVVCIIESMKMMNEIKSHVAGTLEAVNVTNESLVEFHQALLTVKEEADA